MFKYRNKMSTINIYSSYNTIYINTIYLTSIIIEYTIQSIYCSIKELVLTG